MRLLGLLLLGLVILNCAPLSQQCLAPTDGGQDCSSRQPFGCSGTEDGCGPADPNEPSENCVCAVTTPCDQEDRLTCSDGACPSGEFCGEVTVDGADLTMSAQTSPFTTPPGLATSLTNLANGDVIIITGSGTTQYGFEGQAGCSGLPDVDPTGKRTIGTTLCTPRRKACDSGCAVANGKIGQLIAKIGDGPWFAVGTGVIHEVGHNGPDEHGQLYVAYNDEGNFSGNGGSYLVHVERVTGCGCVMAGPIATGAADASCQDANATCEGVSYGAATSEALFAPPDDAAIVTLSSEVPGRSAVHTVTFDTEFGDVQGYSATLTYPADFGFAGFLAAGPANSRVGTYALDLDFDGEPDFRTWIRSTGDDTAYADIDLSGSPTAADAMITRGTGNVFTIVAPDGGDGDPAQSLAIPARVTVTLQVGILTNPPTPGQFGLSLMITSVDPDTGGADDHQGLSPESFLVEQMVPVGCHADTECDDEVACTVDACTAGACTNTPLADIPGAVCSLDELLDDGVCGADPVAPVSSVLAAKVAKAKTLLGQAATAKPKKRIATIKKAEKQLAAAGRTVKKAGKKKTITTACRDTLSALIIAKKGVLKALRTP